MANIGGIVGAEAGRCIESKQNESNQNNLAVYSIRIVKGIQNTMRVFAIVLLLLGAVIASLHFGTDITKKLYSNKSDLDALSFIAIPLAGIPMIISSHKF